MTMSSEQETRVEVGDVWRYAHDGANYTIVRRHEDGHSWRFGDGRGDHFSDGAFGHIGPFGLMLVSRRAPEVKHPERKPPAGYGACKRQCGRYTSTGSDTSCNHCLASDEPASEQAHALASHDRVHGPDWSPAPAEPSARACLAPEWCGFTAGNDKDPRWHAWMKTPTSCKGYIKGEERYCSPACRDAAIPPLSAQGDGPKCRVCSDRHIAPLCNGKCFECFRTKITGPAPAAKHAESVADTRPKCGNNGCKTPYQGVALRACITMDDDGVKNGVAMERSCDPCHLLDEAEFAHNTSVTIATTGTSDVLHNDKVPERLSKPRLSHVAGIHDDDLLAGEGCAR